MNAADQLRKLLDDYYEGVSTPADIESIQRLFDQLPELPEDLAADKEIFNVFAAESLDSTPCPPHLEAMMDETISSLAAKESAGTQRPHLLWVKIASIAAVVAVILGIGYAFIHNSRLDIPQTPAPGIMTQHINQPGNEETKVITEPCQTDADSTIAGDIKPEHELADPATKHSTTVNPTKTTATKPVKKSDIKVITDPAEAEKNTLLAFNCLSKGLNSAREATRQTDETIKEINQKLKIILK